jgi:hypothetical protein
VTLGLACVGLVFSILFCYYVSEDEKGGPVGKARGAGDFGKPKTGKTEIFKKTNRSFSSFPDY